jgi:hypothetical protein
MENTDILKFYEARDFVRLHHEVIHFLEYCKGADSSELEVNLKVIDAFIEQLFIVFSQNNLYFPATYISKYFELYNVLSNLIKISKFENSDKILKKLLKNPEKNIVKILILASPFNSVKLNRERLFTVNEDGAAAWFCHFLAMERTALADPVGFRQLRLHCSNTNMELKVLAALKSIFFASTYIDGKKDKIWKKKFNELIQQPNVLKQFGFKNLLAQKCTNQIAVVSDAWRKGHSVYRNQYHFLKSLSQKYELTLFGIVPYGETLDESLFKSAHYLPLEEMVESLEGKFQMIYFTDVGFTIESNILSNMRLAPLQVTSYGHSVSTFGSMIDYWIGGLKGERGTTRVSQAAIQKRYSETFIGLPGLGITNTVPNYNLKHIKPSEDPFIINCSWSAPKVNYILIKTLKNILNRIKRRNVVFRIFSCNSGLEFLTFRQVIKKQLGMHAEVFPALPYEEYMTLMEEGQFSIESFPFGGCNTVVDALWLKQPIVCLEGNRWYGKIGSCLLIEAGADPDRNTLLASSIPHYEEYIVKLIDDHTLLGTVRTRVSRIDLKSLLFSLDESDHFVREIERLMSITMHELG